MATRWIYNTTDRVWELYATSHPDPLYNTASIEKPTDDQTRELIRRKLSRYFPWLRDSGREAA